MNPEDMADDVTGSDSQTAADVPAGTADAARRRLLKAGLSAAPIILTVRSRPAWAQGTNYPSMSYGDNGTTEEPVAVEGSTGSTTGAPATMDDPKKDKKPKTH